MLNLNNGRSDFGPAGVVENSCFFRETVLVNVDQRRESYKTLYSDFGKVEICGETMMMMMMAVGFFNSTSTVSVPPERIPLQIGLQKFLQKRMPPRAHGTTLTPPRLPL